jgi:hypothetical protein
VRSVAVGERAILPSLRDATGSVGLTDLRDHSEELPPSDFLVTADVLDPVDSVEPVDPVDPVDPAEPSPAPCDPDSDFLGLAVLVSELARESFR